MPTYPISSQAKINTKHACHKNVNMKSAGRGMTHSEYPGFCDMGLRFEGLGDVGPENEPRYEINTNSINRSCQHYSFHNGECSYQQKALK